MPNVLKVAAIKLSTPVTLFVGIKPYDLTFHKSSTGDVTLGS